MNKYRIVVITAASLVGIIYYIIAILVIRLIELIGYIMQLWKSIMSALPINQLYWAALVMMFLLVYITDLVVRLMLKFVYPLWEIMKKYDKKARGSDKDVNIKTNKRRIY